MAHTSHKNPRRLVKICGNRYAADAWRVAAYRPDFMGWIFSPRSPRRIPLELAARLIAGIRRSHPGIQHVGVLAENSVPEIRSLVRSGIGLDFLQIVDGPGLISALEQGGPGGSVARRRSRFYTGPARPGSACRNSYSARERLSLPGILPVVRVRAPLQDADLTAHYGNRPFWLMDSYVPGQPGGTGRRFAPEFVAELRRPFLLAGGLNESNVREALLTTGALGADVSSGIEIPGVPGRKDPRRLGEFVAAVRSLDSNPNSNRNSNSGA